MTDRKYLVVLGGLQVGFGRVNASGHVTSEATEKRRNSSTKSNQKSPEHQGRRSGKTEKPNLETPNIEPEGWWEGRKMRETSRLYYVPNVNDECACAKLCLIQVGAY